MNLAFRNLMKAREHRARVRAGRWPQFLVAQRRDLTPLTARMI